MKMEMDSELGSLPPELTRQQQHGREFRPACSHFIPTSFTFEAPPQQQDSLLFPSLSLSNKPEKVRLSTTDAHLLKHHHFKSTTSNLSLGSGRPQPPPRPCRFFAQGKCKFGDTCYFSHHNPPVEHNIVSEDDTLSLPESSADEDGDDLSGGQMIKGLRRSIMLQKLPADFVSKLERDGTSPISYDEAKSLLGDKRFGFVLNTGIKDGSLFISDLAGYVHLFWTPHRLDRGYILPRETAALLRKISGYIRDQGLHDICWAYVVTDLISGSLVLHGWLEEYTPLCTRYLCQNIDQDKFREKLRSTKNHGCFECQLEEGFAYGIKYGLVEEISRKAVFSCSDIRLLTEGEQPYKIRGVLKYKTLEKALIRLRTHPVAAQLFGFEGWDGTEIYRGPQKEGAIFLGHHGVIMIDCLEIDGEMVAICKSSSGTDMGMENYRGYIVVSLEVMFITAGVKRSKENKNNVACHDKPQYLLSDFYSIDMPYKHEINVDHFYEYFKPPRREKTPSQKHSTGGGRKRRRTD